MKFKDAVEIMYGHLPEFVISEEPNNPYGLETTHELCAQCCGTSYEDDERLIVCRDCKGEGYLEMGRE